MLHRRVVGLDAGRLHLLLEHLHGGVWRLSRALLGEPLWSRPPRLEDAGAEHVRPGEQHRGRDLRAGVGELGVETLGERDDRPLRDGVLGCGRQRRHSPVARRRVHDVAFVATVEHRRHEGVDAVDHAPQVDCHRPCPVVELVLPHRSFGTGADAGVVAHDVDAAVGAECGVAQRFHRAHVGDVRGHAGHLCAVLAHQLDDGVEHVGLHVGEHHLHALGAEALAHRPADATSATGDNGDSALRQVLHSDISVSSADDGQVVVALVDVRQDVVG